MKKRTLLVVLIAVFVFTSIFLLVTTQNPAMAQDEAGEENFHASLEQLAGPFETPQEVTETCLQCHGGAAEEIMATSHWTWTHENEVTGEIVGKQNVINNYCIATQTNERRCTSCHVGYGWKDETFDFTAETNVDCLICHDTTGTYKKFPPGAGMPVLGEAVMFGGVEWQPVDLGLVAQNVGATSRETCGACHFTGGGGDAVKHGDLDRTMIAPSRELDVHMDIEGADFTCTECHATEDHNISGGRYVMDIHTDGEARCETCHGNEPHEGDMADTLNAHYENIACQTCHIPEFARGEPTMMTWDWSTAGDPNPGDGSYPWIVSEELNGFELHVYDSNKGSFTWGMNVVPEYYWTNGVFDYATLDDRVEPGVVYQANAPLGERGDGRIWPFKVFRGSQPYDTVTNYLGVPHLMTYPGTSADNPDPSAFWANWDMGLAMAEGYSARGIEFSGEYGYIETEMYWALSHQVAPASEALACTSCHVEEGRLDWVALGYSEDEAAALSEFPPSMGAEEEMAVEEPAEEAVAEEQAEAEEEVAEEEAAPEPATEEEPAAVIAEQGFNTGWLLVGGLVVVAAGALYFFINDRRKHA